jgi:hypothetical protein
VRERDGVAYEGERLRVELSRSGISGSRHDPPRHDGFHGDDRGRSGYRGSSGGDARQDYGGSRGGGGYERDERDSFRRDWGGDFSRYAGDRGGYRGGGPGDEYRGGYRDRFPDRGSSFLPRGGGAPGRGGGVGKRTDFRIQIEGLPLSASWQDLKDFFRMAGEVVYSDVDKRGGGIVEFANERQQEDAISKFDKTDWINPRKHITETGLMRIRKTGNSGQSGAPNVESSAHGELGGDHVRTRRAHASRSRSGSRHGRRSRSRYAVSEGLWLRVESLGFRSEWSAVRQASNEVSPRLLDNEHHFLTFSFLFLTQGVCPAGSLECSNRSDSKKERRGR